MSSRRDWNKCWSAPGAWNSAKHASDCARQVDGFRRLSDRVRRFFFIQLCFCRKLPVPVNGLLAGAARTGDVESSSDGWRPPRQPESFGVQRFRPWKPLAFLGGRKKLASNRFQPGTCCGALSIRSKKNYNCVGIMHPMKEGKALSCVNGLAAAKFHVWWQRGTASTQKPCGWWLSTMHPLFLKQAASRKELAPKPRSGDEDCRRTTRLSARG